MGDDTEQMSMRDKLGDEECSSTDLVRNCTEYNGPEVAGQKMEFLSMKYYGGRLFKVFASFGRGAFPDISAAFAAKYGPPAKVDVQKWQSRAGGTFDNRVSKWRFKGGTLELSEMGLDVSSGSFEFTSDENSPPPSTPKVDF